MPHYELKRAIIHEGDEFNIPAGRNLQPLAVFKVEYLKDGQPKTALEVWFFEIT